VALESDASAPFDPSTQLSDDEKEEREDDDDAEDEDYKN
jgi:hypothetical protein